MAQMTGGEAIIQALQREGVDHVFGLDDIRAAISYAATLTREEEILPLR